MYVLDQLWRGEITPMERCVRRGSEYQRVAREVCEKIDELFAALTPEAQKQFEAISALKTDINVMENEDYFVYGFRLWAGMVLDIVGAYNGPFCSPSESV